MSVGVIGMGSLRWILMMVITSIPASAAPSALS